MGIFSVPPNHEGLGLFLKAISGRAFRPEVMHLAALSPQNLDFFDQAKFWMAKTWPVQELLMVHNFSS